MLFEIDTVLLAVAGIVTPFLVRAGRADRRQAVADALAKLAEAGLETSGDPLVHLVAHPVGRAEIVLWNRTHTRPGGSESSDDACVVTFAVPLADQIVCRAAEADVVVGPLPVVPRVRTGHASFDGGYAIFVGPAGGAPSDGSYRAAAAANDIPWAQPALLDRLQEFGLIWLRVHEGRAELVFPPLEIEDMGRAARIALAIEHAAHGRQAPSLVPGPRTSVVQRWDLGAAPLILGWCASPLTGLIGGLLLTFLLGSLGVDEELACGTGHHIVWVHVARGSSLSCSPYSPHGSSLGLYHLACMLLVAALTALEQYAAYRAELAVFPGQSDNIHRRYGVAATSARAALHEAFAKRFADEPGLRDRWQALVAHYEGWYRGGLAR